ncbi:MAG: hypothetical protein M1377_05790, partial [Deltaproteobacteria bacterium]|nr:hypothetical protein [Deltaproteobacteria bacterium]
MEEKEQHSSLNRGEDDEPILVLKYVGGRVAWRLFFPYSIAMPIFYMIVFHWAPGKPVSFMTIFSEIVGILFLIIWALLTPFCYDP